MNKPTPQQRFKPRKRTKTGHSQRDNTARTRQWERSKVGLKSGLLKIDRNKRVAIFREREHMRKKKEWNSLTKEEREDRDASMIERVTAHYENEKTTLRHMWYNNEDVGELEKEAETECDDSMTDVEETDGCDSEFEMDEGEEEVRSPESKAKLSHSIADIYNQALENIKGAVKGFEEWGSHEEEPADDEYNSGRGEEEDADDNAEDSNEV